MFQDCAMEDWVEESPSEEDDTNEIENELYSMFYYHSMSEGIPDDLSKKYNIDINDFGVTISVKNASCDYQSDGGSEDNDQSKQEDLGNVTNANDRYTEERKGNRESVCEASDTSSNKRISEAKVDETLLRCIKLPNVSPVHQRISKFQSSRYFSEEKKNNQNPYNKFSHRSDNNLAVYTKNSDILNHSSDTLFPHDKLSSSTPIAKRKLNCSKELPQKVIKNKFINDVIDLTQESPKKRKNKKKNKHKKKNEIPVITISSESESGSDNESEVSLTSESDSADSFNESFDSILLNTSMPVDKNNCDISFINIDYDWKQTSSPEGWTHSMRKFYNKPSKKHLNFDYRDILKKIRSEGSCDWSICKADLNRFKSSRRVRCLRCQQEGHVKANCTKVFSCHMCGTPGHSFKQCPQKMCLKCGSKCRDVFPSGCVNCVDKMTCSYCGLKGHSSKLCNVAWRTLSLVGGSKINNERTGTKYCCNCGKSGHYYEDCRKRCNSAIYSIGNNFNTSKDNFKRNPKSKKCMKHFDKFIVGNQLSSNLKTKVRLRSRNLNLNKNEKYRGLNLHSSNEKVKKKHISKRILMLRKTNKKNKYKACFSNAV